MHAKLEIHFDKDDGINKYEIYRIGAFTFEDTLGEIQASWRMHSKEEIIENLKKICEFLEISICP